jgi:hypothetical protein
MRYVGSALTYVTTFTGKGGVAGTATVVTGGTVLTGDMMEDMLIKIMTTVDGTEAEDIMTVAIGEVGQV